MAERPRQSTSPKRDMPASPEATEIAGGRGWRIAHYVCHAGPEDRAFEEARGGFTIAAVLEGTFTYKTDTGAALMHPGSLLLGNHSTCYSCGHDHSRGDRCVALHMEPEYFREIAATAAGSGHYKFAAPMLPALPELQPWSFRSLALLDAEQDAGIEEAAIALVERVISLASGSQPSTQRVSAHDEKRISRALHVLEAEFAEAHDLDHLAGIAGMSKYHFLRTFRRLVGLAPYQYLLGLRLRHVASRLMASTEPVSTIAFEAGFGDLSTFTQRFKQSYGLSPTQFRHRHGEPKSSRRVAGFPG